MKHRLFVLAACAFALSPLPASAAQCVNINLDLAQGSTDSRSGGQVTVLQQYLSGAGFLAAKPNGVFGPATLAAVKKFQGASGVAANGSVGALTRAALAIKSCASVPVATPSTPTVSTVHAPIQTSVPIGVLMPQSGETMKLGQTYAIRWTGPALTDVYSIILEDATGTPKGFIAPSTSGTEYSWLAGSIHDSSNRPNLTVPPGTYRIHVQSAVVGAQSTDRLSGVFSITAAIEINQIYPRAIPVDGTAAVIFGSGFTRGTVARVDGYSNTIPLFVSPDGRVLVFTVPRTMTPGLHRVAAVNGYGSSDVTTESPELTFTVIR